MEKKQSSVEWLYERLERMIPRSPLYNGDKIRYLEQAKAMHEQEHEDTWLIAQIEDKDDSYIGTEMTFLQYYNETFDNGKETK